MQGCSSLVSQYHNTDVWTFLKLMIMIEHIKRYKYPILTYGQCFFLDKCLIGAIPVSCFGIYLEDPVLVQTLSYRRKITYYLLLIGFFHKLISMEHVEHNILHLHVRQQLSSLYMHQWVISPTNDNDAELKRQFPFGTDLNKVLANLFKLRTKTEKPDIKFS